jgi:SAM-dependent MidA family methyltransferase
MELALYHPDYGYYVTPDRRPGRGGDFLTAPETTPYFGVTLATQIGECWDRLGRPEPFTIREYGAGVGGLAYDIIAGLSQSYPALLDGLRYRLIETNPHRLEQALDAMAQAGLTRIVAPDEPGPDGQYEPIIGVVLANEVADAFPVHRLVVLDGGVRELYGRCDADGQFVEQEGPLSAPDHLGWRWEVLAAAGVRLSDGDIVEVSPAAEAWFADVARQTERGYVIVIDYGYLAHELYQSHRLRGTLRAYHQHTVTDAPFARIGRQDLTAHVNFSALIAAGEAEGLAVAGFTTQAMVMERLGLGAVLLGLQDDPTTTAEEYFATRAAIFRLIDPGGMGRFGVLIMAKNAPTDPPLRGVGSDAAVTDPYADAMRRRRTTNR